MMEVSGLIKNNLIMLPDSQWLTKGLMIYLKKKKRESEAEIEKFHMDIASSIQKVTENLIIIGSLYNRQG